MNGMMLLVTCFVIVTTSFAVSGKEDNLLPSRECEADHMCKDGFCYIESGKCVECTNCTLYLRKLLIWRSCAKSISDCGSCMDGYEEDFLQEGNRRDFCIPVKSKAKVPMDDSTSQNTMYYIIGGVLIVLVVLTLAVGALFCLYRKILRDKLELGTSDEEECINGDSPGLSRNKQECVNVCIPEEELRPPPYSPTFSHEPLLRPTAPIVSDEIVENVVKSKEETENVNFQKATPFRPCVYDQDEYDGESGDDDVASDDNDSDPGAHGLDLHDEATQPSTWTPGALYRPMGDPDNGNDSSNNNNNNNNDDNSTTHMLHSTTLLPTGNFQSGASLPTLRGADAAIPDDQQTVTDSGVSDYCSEQSSIVDFRPFGMFSSSPNEVGTSNMDTAMPTVPSTITRCRSEDDLPLSARKRVRQDSGSLSMQSGPPEEDCNVFSGPPCSQYNV